MSSSFPHAQVPDTLLYLRLTFRTSTAIRRGGAVPLSAALAMNYCSYPIPTSGCYWG